MGIGQAHAANLRGSAFSRSEGNPSPGPPGRRYLTRQRAKRPVPLIGFVLHPGTMLGYVREEDNGIGTSGTFVVAGTATGDWRRTSHKSRRQI